MTRTLLLACRHRIANDCMALGREPSPMLAEIDAVLAGPKVAEGAHTQGDWACNPETGEIYLDDGDVYPQIAQVNCENTAPGQAKADCHLIASAAVMLAALEPFAKLADSYRDDAPGHTIIDETRDYEITLGHCRAARSAYRKAKGGAA